MERVLAALERTLSRQRQLRGSFTLPGGPWPSQRGSDILIFRKVFLCCSLQGGGGQLGFGVLHTPFALSHIVCISDLGLF